MFFFLLFTNKLIRLRIRHVPASCFCHFHLKHRSAFSELKFFSFHLSLRWLLNSFNNFSIGKIHRTVADALQRTGIYLIWKKRKKKAAAYRSACFYTLYHSPIAQSRQNHRHTIFTPPPPSQTCTNTTCTRYLYPP